MFCLYCHQPCGEREFCDEACYSEYEQAMAEWRDSIKDEYPVGESRYDNDDPPVWDVQGGL